MALIPGEWSMVFCDSYVGQVVKKAAEEKRAIAEEEIRQALVALLACFPLAGVASPQMVTAPASLTEPLDITSLPSAVWALKQIQSFHAVGKIVAGGFFLRKKPRSRFNSPYSNSESAAVLKNGVCNCDSHPKTGHGFGSLCRLRQ